MGSKTIAKQGKEREEMVATTINRHPNFVNTTIEALAFGGSGHGSDVSVEKDGKKLFSIEVKTKKSPRLDFGQCDLAYDEKTGWYQKTQKGLDNPVLVHAFSILKKEADKIVKGKIPSGVTPFYEQETRMLWKNIEPDLRGRSIKSADIIKVPIPKDLLPKYYRDKGDSFLAVGEDFYSLEDKKGKIPSLSEAVKTCYAVLRVKNRQSSKVVNPKRAYTMALRTTWVKDHKSEIDTALWNISLD
tara:strand:- start:415 stop:1146 length:732 start_codon:yes stop_codon:yes gene_type:complete